MQLKRPSQYGHWVFWIGGKEDADHPELEIDKIRVPLVGYYSTKEKLSNAVVTELKNLAAQGHSGYMESIQEEAASYGKKPKVFLDMLIEHQICVTVGKRAGLCWDTTFGDKVHSVTEKFDTLIDKAPPTVKRVFRKAVAYVAPKTLGRVSSCRGCGGGKSLKISKNNRGRSGRI